MESSDNDGCSDLASRFMRDTDSDSSLMSASEAEVFDPLVPEEYFNVCCDAFGPEVAFGFEPPPAQHSYDQPGYELPAITI